LKAIQKFNKTVNVPAQRPESTERPQEQAFMYVRADKKMVKIIYDDILYIEGLKDYVQLFMKDRKVLTHYTLNSFEEKLPELTFMRVHRSYIVSLPQITAFTARSVEVGEKEIPIGDVYQAKVAGRLG
jgi:DNA-binding LytR/AlgR family response regulator